MGSHSPRLLLLSKAYGIHIFLSSLQGGGGGTLILKIHSLLSLGHISTRSPAASYVCSFHPTPSTGRQEEKWVGGQMNAERLDKY
jgi:hypothetical protein